jgi:prepilin-type N-terminal cleavage/methylation domain-containing protein
MYKRVGSSRGFTMIELLFAMSFVSVLLIIILTATIGITRIYNKGITLKQVNQSGAAIGSELEASMASASAPLGTSAVDKGRLCLGTYSYVWNTPTVAPQNTLSDGTAIGMVKVTDTAQKMCAAPFPKPQPANDPHELILGAGSSNGGVGLILRSFTVDNPVTAGADYLYHVAFTISTNDGSLIASDGSACKGGASDEFCALNAFDFTVFVKHGGDGSV